LKESKLNALIDLLEDDDEQIFEQISNEIFENGIESIPYLEKAWEEKPYGPDFRTKVEDLIHDIQFNNVTSSLELWAENGSKDLLTGLLLINKYHYPDLDPRKTIKEIDRLSNDFGKLLNTNLSPHQQVVQLNRFLFTELKFKGDNDNYYAPYNSLIAAVVERRKGNPLLISLVFKLIANANNIPIVGINLPRHFIVGYKDKLKNAVTFYLSPFNQGTLLSQDELEDYLNKLNLPFEPQYFEECSHLEIIKRVLLNLINSFSKLKNVEKTAELSELYLLIKDI